MMGWIFLFLGIGGSCFWLSWHQPFPEISRRYAYLVLMAGSVLIISEQAPRETSETVPMYFALGLGVLGTLKGSWDMTRTMRDVIVAPFAGGMLCAGSAALLVGWWDEGGTYEHISSFILVSALILMEIYLVFRGLIIGVPGLSWSKAGLRQIQRGLLDGPSGAISCFERSWDADEEWLGAMSHAALIRIYIHLEQEESANNSEKYLEEFGGWEVVDSAWIEAIDSALNSISESKWSEPIADM
ncbi:MAG TPA: hypothetical protein D7H76_05365 [Candidatus Poseidoniales archaeon]|nr:MAG TPA: hypothetical protein D7H73_05005 [Candidatus Poseidoniales archaeon]DAC24074.1 MAG TPA: hypothetical protein D7H76_05365 [Candidatus Poseidoniales archaeon]HII53169.1 hypothetical protein [Candidatus Thalassarchaeaceae archaeon]|tara:strand:+ start:4078 stop:4806 length:729 start_codon:yes stop_codon:yes gene_type:complete